MGFRPEPTQYKLNFEGSDLDGLQVVMGSLSVSEFNEMIRSALQTGLTEDTVKANERVLEMFADKLISWNLEDQKGKAVPPNLKGIQTQESKLVARLVTEWQKAMVSVSDDLGKESANGSLTQEESALLASSSTSLKS